MSNHPLNLTIRFLLELALLAIFGIWGWHTFTGPARWLAAIGLPVAAATIWGIFRVDNDPGKAPVVIPGWLRLLYEIFLFTAASWCLLNLHYFILAYTFIIISVLHYLVSYERIVWMLKK